MADRYDMIIVGAGINGCGIARDASRRGMRVLLIDQGDIGGGTTAASTRLIHGGLRYLEYLDLRLVRESLRERDILLRVAPHLVKPLQFLLPLFHTGRRSRRKIAAGLALYRALSPRSPLPAPRMLDPKETIECEPGLCPDGLAGGALYWDAQVAFPERLAVENAIDAHTHGATIVTHVSTVELVRSTTRIAGVGFDRNGASTEATAPIVVNATGAWADVLAGTGEAPIIGATRGTHVVVERWQGAPVHAIYAEASDGRPIFVFPWNDLVLIGTTDVAVAHPTLNVVPETFEVEYLLDAANRLFAPRSFQFCDVCYTFAGLRPLPRQSNSTPGSITRRHQLLEHSGTSSGLISVVGGKITTYRALAENLVTSVRRQSGAPESASDTRSAPLPGAGVEPRVDPSGLDAATRTRLLAMYGSRAGTVAELANTRPDLANRLSPTSSAIAAEVVFALRDEFAASISDILMRRTMLGLDADVGTAVVESVTQVASTELGWDACRMSQERASYQEVVDRRRLPHRDDVESMS